MVAYLEKNKRGHYSQHVLVICEKPCNGYDYISSPRIEVSGKREANKICKERGLKPWNF